MGSAKERENRWAIAPPPSPASSAISGEFRFEPPSTRSRRDLGFSRQGFSEQVGFSEQETRPGAESAQPMSRSRVRRRPLEESFGVADLEFPDSEKVTEVPTGFPEAPLADRDADTVPAPPELDLDD